MDTECKKKTRYKLKEFLELWCWAALAAHAFRILESVRPFGAEDMCMSRWEHALQGQSCKVR